MRGLWFLLLFVSAVLCCSVGAYAAGPSAALANQGMGTIEVQAVAIVKTPGHATARRSVGPDGIVRRAIRATAAVVMGRVPKSRYYAVNINTGGTQVCILTRMRR